MSEQSATAPALTTLSEDETLFQRSVFAFADREIRPLVAGMDAQAAMPRQLSDQLFALGVMGIEAPEAHGGAGGTFFHAILAVEALSRVDPSVGVLVDVQNTLVINALLRWGTEAQSSAVTECSECKEPNEIRQVVAVVVRAHAPG